MNRAPAPFLGRTSLVLAIAIGIVSALGCAPREAAEAVDSTEVGEAGTPASEDRPHGLIVDRPEAADGYTLFSPLLSDTSYLIDRKGQVVHLWKTSYAASSLYLLDDGHLLRTGRDPEAVGFKAGGVTGYIQKLDWDGNLVWELRLSSDDQILHHDIAPMPNGNILALGWEVKSPEEARAAGRRPELIGEHGLWPEFVVEIEPLRDGEARIVWEWHVWDHLVQDHDPELANYGDPAAHPHRVDVNRGGEPDQMDPEEFEQLKALGYIPEDAEMEELAPDFQHANSIDYHPGLDQIVISVPQLGEIWVIDHSISTEEARGPAGDLLYRWGNPAVYGRGEPRDQQLFSQHDARWIAEGMPGAGHLMIFDNGGGHPEGNRSAVVEIVPPVDDSGRYPLAEGEAWGPAKPTWSYTDRERFFAPFISGAHRMANGHTFVTQGPQARFFEVTPEGNVVWEYWQPFLGNVRNRDGSPAQPVDEFHHACFRATKLPADHPAFAGRELAPLDPQPPLGQRPGEAASDSSDSAAG